MYENYLSANCFVDKQQWECILPSKYVEASDS